MNCIGVLHLSHQSALYVKFVRLESTLVGTTSRHQVEVEPNVGEARDVISFGLRAPDTTPSSIGAMTKRLKGFGQTRDEEESAMPSVGRA